jgi:hypothetical protein
MRRRSTNVVESPVPSWHVSGTAGGSRAHFGSALRLSVGGTSFGTLTHTAASSASVRAGRRAVIHCPAYAAARMSDLERGSLVSDLLSPLENSPRTPLSAVERPAPVSCSNAAPKISRVVGYGGAVSPPTAGITGCRLSAWMADRLVSGSSDRPVRERAKLEVECVEQGRSARSLGWWSSGGGVLRRQNRANRRQHRCRSRSK